MIEKRCSKCGETKDANSDFYHSKSGKINAYCKPCWIAYGQDRRNKHRAETGHWWTSEEQRQRSSEKVVEYQRAHRDETRAKQKRYEDQNREKLNAHKREFYASNTEHRRAIVRKCMADPNRQEARKKQANRRNRQTKLDAIHAYGGACYCCKESWPDMLTLDHINQRGSEHRRETNPAKRMKGTDLHKWAKDNNWPDTLRLACWNCNLSAFYNNGVCGHALELEMITGIKTINPHVELELAA